MTYIAFLSKGSPNLVKDGAPFLFRKKSSCARTGGSSLNYYGRLGRLDNLPGVRRKATSPGCSVRVFPLLTDGSVTMSEQQIAQDGRED